MSKKITIVLLWSTAALLSFLFRLVTAAEELRWSGRFPRLTVLVSVLECQSETSDGEEVQTMVQFPDVHLHVV